MPITDNWIGGTGIWSVGTNWSGSSKPGALDGAVFNAPSDATLTNTEFEDAASLTMSSANQTLTIQGELTIGDAHLNGVSNFINTGSASLNVDGGGLIAGQYITSASGTVHLSNSGSYEWMGSGSTQTIDMGEGINDSFDFSTQFGGNLTNFYAGDIISYNGQVNSVTIGDNLISFNATNGQTYNIALAGGTYDSSNLTVVGNSVTSDVTAPVCFAAGTLIRTTRGDIAVEALQVGDMVVTAVGVCVPIMWIGRRTFYPAGHPEPNTVLPIRVQAGAFGNGQPYRDLTLSPHHAVAVKCVGEVLIPIRLLLNGKTIVQIDASEITYWHVELDSHDILIANGLSAESYIDVGNRCDFEGEATLALHPLFKSDALAAYCRPLVTGGPVLSAVRSRLATLSGERAFVASEPALFHLLVDGALIAPVVKGNRAAFVVPSGASDIRLVSQTWSPRDVDPKSGDDRSLGLLIEALAIDDMLGTVTEIPLDDSGLVAGFHPTERTDFGTWRWTNGDALIAASVRTHLDGPFVLCLTGQFHHAGTKINVAEAA